MPDIFDQITENPPSGDKSPFVKGGGHENGDIFDQVAGPEVGDIFDRVSSDESGFFSSDFKKKYKEGTILSGIAEELKPGIDVIKPVPALAASNVVEAGAGAASLLGFDDTAEKLRDDANIVRRQVQEEHPLEPGSWPEATRNALTSIYSQGPALAIGAATGGATIPLSMLGTQAGLQKASELDEAGYGKGAQLAAGTISGLAEAFTEKIPFDTLFAKGIDPGKRILRMLISEQLGEQAANAVDQGIDKITIRPDMTMDDFIGTVKATAKATVIQSLLMGAGASIGSAEVAGPAMENNPPQSPLNLRGDEAVKEGTALPAGDIFDQVAEGEQDRRHDYGRREQIQNVIDSGDIEGAHKLIYEDPLTGLLNRRALDEAEPKAMAEGKTFTLLDISGLKFANDNFGYDAGDALLQAKADALNSAGLQAYRKGGDEVVIIEANEASLKKASDDLANRILDFKKPDGTIESYKGWRFDYATGKSIGEADKALKSKRAELVERGERNTRGGQPVGVSQILPEGYKDLSQTKAGIETPSANNNAPQPPLNLRGGATVIEEIPVIKSVMQLSSSHRESLAAVREEVSQGQPGQRIPIKDEDGNTIEWRAIPSTYPEYFRDKGYKKKDAISTIDRVLKGFPVSKKQQILIEDLNTGYRSDAARRIAGERTRPKEISSLELNEGDSLKRHGERFVVKDVRENGSVVLQDHVKVVLSPDESMMYDRGTLRKSTTPAPPDQGGEPWDNAQAARPELVEGLNKKVEQIASVVKEIQRIAAPGTEVKIAGKIDLAPDTMTSIGKWGEGDLGDTVSIKGAHRVVEVDGHRMKSVISLALNEMDPKTTPYHEAFHSVQELLLSDHERSILEKAFPEKDGVSSNERQARAFADYVNQRGQIPPASVRAIFENIRKFLEHVRAHLKGQEITSSGIFEAAYKGELRKRAEEGATFKTEKGSIYTINQDGTTTRNKAKRLEHGADFGPQPKSEKTWYVTPNDAERLGEIQATNSNKRRIAEVSNEGGKIGIQYTDGPNAGKFERRTVVFMQQSPRNGLIPVEIWNDGKTVHFGNKITEIGTKDEFAAFAPEKDFRREANTEGAEGIQKRSDIVNFLNEKLNVPIKTGRFAGTGRGVLGVFKGKEEVIRTKFANDIETIAHEVGHGLQKYLWPDSVNASKGAAGFSGKPFEAFEHELEPIATPTRKGQAKSTEGFAEFIRLYVTNEAEAIQKAPEFYNSFENLLKEEHPEVRDILLQTREDFNRWINQPAMARVLSQISIGETKKPTRDINSLLKEAYTATIDDLYPLRSIVKEMTGKEELPAVSDPYKLARLLRGWWGKAESFLEYKPFDYNTYAWKGKSLKEILEPVKDNLDEFRAYIVSRRALELQTRGIESGIQWKDAANVVKDLDGKYAGTLKDLSEYQDSILQYLGDSGVIAPKDMAKMKAANRSYVPFYRVFESDGAGPAKGMEASKPIKTIKGSWRDIVDPLESIVKNTYLFINAAERNSVGRALVDLANSREGMGKFIERIPIPKAATKVNVGEVLDKWADKMDDPHIKEMLKDMNLSSETVSIFRPSAFVPQEGVISVWNRGRRELYEVSPDIARAFKALDKETTNTIIKLLSKPASWLRAGATLAPEFIARNPLRDQFSAFVYSKYGYAPIFDLPKAIASVAKGDEIYWDWKRSGGEHSMLVSMDREYLQKNLKGIMESRMEGMKGLVKNPLEALRVISELGEAATRVGEFSRGVKKEGSTKKGMLDAAFSSREVTLDFARIGAKTKAVNAIVAFWNAQVQGNDRMVRAFKERPMETSLKVMAGITLPSILLAVANHDDERWKEIPQWQKDLFWIVMTDEHIYRIPKPFELGIVFGTIPERMIDAVLNKNPRAFDRLIDTIANGAIPGTLPTVALPFIEGWANKSFFTDRALVPRSKENLPSQYQYQPYTTEAAKQIGAVLLKIVGDESSISSPAKIENTIKGLTGGLGSHALNLADFALRKAGVVPDKVKPSPTLSDIPFIKAFAVRYPASDAESVQRFYDDYGKIKAKMAAAKGMIKEFEIEKAKVILSSGDLVKLDRVEKALAKTHQLIDLVNANPKMTAEDKRQLIDKSYLNMIEIARSGNEILDIVKKKK